MSTIKDVAKQANVSISTVSNALNGKKYVKPETAQKVLSAAAELKFSFDATARNMKSSQSHLIGVILPSIVRTFYLQVLSGLNVIADKEGYRIILYSSEYDLDKEKDFLYDLVGLKVDGIILDSLADPEIDSEYISSLLELHQGKKHVHIVSMGRDLSGFGVPSICWDNTYGARIAVESLIKRGARRIVFMSSYSARGGKSRFDGYIEALKDYSIPFDNQLCLQVDKSSWGGYCATKKLFEDGITFDALFAGSDQRAIGALKAIQELGLHIPEDIMVCGFDNSFVSSIIQPPLTTVNVPKYTLGQNAAEWIIEYINGKDLSYKSNPLLLPLQLIERESSNPSKHTAWVLDGW